MLIAAGHDPSGGAGLLADLSAVEAAGARGWAAAAAVTAQGQGGARGYCAVTPELLVAQVDALVGGPERIAAVKVGMIGSARNAAALAARLRRAPLARVPVVVDPVLAATSGAALFDPGPLTLLHAFEPLFERAALATPNLLELRTLTGLPVRTDAEAIQAARRLGCRAVLVKGGHRRGAPVDLLVEGRRVTRFEGRRRKGTARGTGCRLASAVAALLAQRLPLAEAVARGKALVERYLDGAAG
ncbi:bifunctional hydroxymethylpyrimidine kinase/phosphomethylpyrimidine kinase [Anaeromyxobacter paludicola]|uniref:bifunctional hydroxymethylpyrimidine kinase/phosphomethylpyrimidine kinase n=1 Tax=Anaeromyxobacter paludicola TaxID=2918171 RepID=UPI0020BE139B|nr:bifunctional hydroxymethylpyrimidine kinase/phosphomethylpyrimidine kinase [Anaeromyxobacter paludicola]